MNLLHAEDRQRRVERINFSAKAELNAIGNTQQTRGQARIIDNQLRHILHRIVAPIDNFLKRQLSVRQRDQVCLDRDLALLVAHTDASVSVIKEPLINSLIGRKRLFLTGIRPEPTDPGC